jgi:hypothetical protein
MQRTGSERSDDEQRRAAQRSERDEQKRRKRRFRWLRDSEVARSVNAAVQDDDYER